MAEKSKRTNGPCCVTLDARQRLDRRLRLALGCAKGREIVRAQQLARGRAHRGRVERTMVPAGETGEQRGPFRAHQQQIRVVAGRRRKARMEVLGHRMRPQHRGRGRQVRVDAAHPRRVRTLRIRLEMHDLRHGMHAGIGAPGRGHRHRVAGDLRRSRAPARPARRNPTAATGSRRTRGRNIRRRVRSAWRDRNSGTGNRKKLRAADQTTRRPWMLLEESRQASFASSALASVFCWSSPSWSTSCRISRAPSTSPIS